MLIREETTADLAIITEINDEAFKGPDESKLVNQLREDGMFVTSLVALDEQKIPIGHILFSKMDVEVDGKQIKCCSLAPISVRESYQKQGVGKELIQRGLAIVKEKGYEAVIVLGHIEYYPKFGFRHGLVSHLKSPFQDKEAFMGLELVPGTLTGNQGHARYPPAFGIEDS